METTISNQKIFTVSELNQIARLILEDHFPLIWIEGEISNLSKPSSGHIYFSLKDKNCQVRCAMFAMRHRGINFMPENGLQILVQAKVSLYEGRGDFQLIVQNMEPAGDGALKKAFELLKNKLQQEGLFDEKYKQPLPKLAKQVGVITSSTGAAVRDILTTLQKRFPALPVIIYPTLVQGEGSAENIARMIEIANQRQECDVLIVARGGGSLEDLWAFNTEVVARAIFASQIPIISAIGHEVDFTISDFVADQRAATPTAAASLVCPDNQEWQEWLLQSYQRLVRAMQLTFKHKQQLLKEYALQLRHPGQRLQEQAQRIDEIEIRLKRAMQVILQNNQHQLNNLARALNAISPLATLQRGYAIVKNKDDHIITQCNAVKNHEALTIIFADGEIRCTVTN